MRAALAIAVLLAAAAPASAADTIGRGALTAGPVLAGGSVLWADAPSGRPRVLSGGPGRRATVLRAWPRATTKDTGRTVAALAGSAGASAAVVETCTTRVDGDAVFLGCAERAFGGSGQGFAPFGARTAAARSRIVLRRGTKRRSIPSRGATDVRIAGRRLAYVEGTRRPERAVVRDLRRRTLVRALAMDGLESVDVQADGTLALLAFNGASTCAFLARPGAEPVRLDCGVTSRDVAVAGGRALFARGRELRLAGTGGGRTLARARRGMVFGGLDLRPGRAVWSVGEPSGFQRIVSRAL